jgi:hypothetical protein
MPTLSRFQSRSARDRLPATVAGDPELAAGGRPAPIRGSGRAGTADPDPGPLRWSGMFAAAGSPGATTAAAWSVPSAAA